jgi:Sulfotransferase family
MRWPYQALSAAFGIADAVVPKALLPSTQPDALIAAAGTNPTPGAREGLRQLITAIDADSELSFFGKVSLRWDMIRLLRNAQTVEDAQRSDPAIAAAPVTAPIFILGLPRSGTSFLHSLMAEDHDNQVPRNWQTIYPGPRPAGFNPATDKRVRDVDKQLNLFAGLAPGFAAMHPITANSPQECSEITAHVFQSLRFDTTFRVPSYLHWVETQGHRGAFEFHKRFLQYLQAGAASRWVLKCPDHTFSLDAILEVYPDARFVVVHRDPIAVLGSVAHLTEVLRKPFLRNIDPAEIGAQVGSRWIEGANLLLEFDRRADVDPARKIHLHYEDVTRAPLAAIERIYGQFGLPLRAQAVEAISEKVSARPRGGYGSHAPYSLETFELSTQTLQDQFAPYVSQHCR